MILEILAIPEKMVRMEKMAKMERMVALAPLARQVLPVLKVQLVPLVHQVPLEIALEMIVVLLLVVEETQVPLDQRDPLAGQELKVHQDKREEVGQPAPLVQLE